MAILIDIRRDNLLLHLLFKSLFELSRTRVDYLAHLTGRGPPEPIGPWPSKPVDAIVRYVDETPPLRGPALEALRARIVRTLQTYGVPLSTADLQTIARFHSRFIEEGASLRFNTTGRAPQFDYPTYRDLLLEVDTTGAQRGFLASEESFQFVKALQARHLVVPIVGDLSGSSALAAVGRFLQTRGERVSSFYTSNVEYYLFRQGTFDRFIGNLTGLPRAGNAVVIRSVFGGGLTPPRPGYNSVSLTQPIQALLNGYARGQFRQYRELTLGELTLGSGLYFWRRVNRSCPRRQPKLTRRQK
jgi:hypothetical protein